MFMIQEEAFPFQSVLGEESSPSGVLLGTETDEKQHVACSEYDSFQKRGHDLSMANCLLRDEKTQTIFHSA